MGRTASLAAGFALGIIVILVWATRRSASSPAPEPPLYSVNWWLRHGGDMTTTTTAQTTTWN